MIQREIESRGIPTVSISLVRAYTEKIRPPRAVFLHWPFGHPFGEPGHVNQQSSVLMKTLQALYAIETPGEIIDLPWAWRRHNYPPPPWTVDPPRCKLD